MNTYKKIVFVASCIFSIQFIIHAYDSSKLTTQLQSIKNYITKLRQQNDSASREFAALFEKKINTPNTTDDEIIFMAGIANYESLTESKITSLSKKMNYVISHLFAMTLLGFAVLAAYYQYLEKQRNSGWT